MAINENGILVQRQYIGARYVIKIYENSQDTGSADWEPSTNYEPLVMVTYNYGSYLSKKNVPATVGNPADNPQYWVQTGFYNGQIASLQQQIDDIKDGDLVGSIQNQINTMNDGTAEGSLQSQINDLSDRVGEKQIVVLTDSYGMSGDTYAEHSFLYYLDTMGIENYCNKWGYAYEGSIGFNPSNPSGTFQALVQNDIASVDNDKVTDIYVVGGTNDAKNGDNITTLQPGFDAFFTNAKTKYPNVKTITMIYVPHMPLNNYNYTYPQITYYAYINGFMNEDVDAQFINAINAFSMQDLLSDKVHPALAAQKKLARYILGVISGSKTKPCDYIYTAPEFGLNSAVTGTGSCTVEQNDSVDTVTLSISITDFGSFASATSLANIGNARITLGEELFFNGILNGTVPVPCRISREGYFSILGRGGQTTNSTFLAKAKIPVANYLVCPQS